MTHLGMYEAMHQATVGEATTTDACAHGQVKKSRQTLRGPPAFLAKRGDVNVGIEADGYAECSPDSSDHVSLRPARLGCRGDVAIVRRITIRRYRAERPDADCVDLLWLEES